MPHLDLETTPSFRKVDLNVKIDTSPGLVKAIALWFSKLTRTMRPSLYDAVGMMPHPLTCLKFPPRRHAIPFVPAVETNGIGMGPLLERVW